MVAGATTMCGLARPVAVRSIGQQAKASGETLQSRRSCGTLTLHVS